MDNLEEFIEKWKGRKFRCKDTGVEFTVPDCVFYRDFYIIGKGFLDVGDGYYARFGGNIEELSQ